jgi:hypothetical protein
MASPSHSVSLVALQLLELKQRSLSLQSLATRSVANPLPKAPRITCSWCGTSVEPNMPRMRLHESESTRHVTKCLATFHPECGDALLDYCERRVARLKRENG